MIYLDSAATTLEKPESVSAAVAKALKHCASPGRGGYPAAMQANDILFQCRELAADLFSVPTPEQVILTHNATHGLNIAIRSLVKPHSRVVISGFEHNAVTRVLNSIPNVYVTVVKSKLFDPEDSVRSFELAITDDVDAVICNHVSNVFGYIQPIKQIASMCRQHHLPLIIDASQSAGMIPFSMKDLDAEFIAMPGHKGLYGPQGTGLLLCKNDAEPILYGGTGSASLIQSMPDFLPDRLEAGTPNVCGAAGLLAGMKFVQKKGVQQIGKYEAFLRRKMAQLLQSNSKIHVFEGDSQSGVLSFVVEDTDCEILGEQLAMRGIAVRTGLHCSPLAHKTAGTLDSGTVRISFSVFNSLQQVEYAAHQIKKIVS